MKLGAFYRSTIGKKLIMALTGVVWVGYVVAHMTGNLLVFAGAESINGYAHKLREMPALLWAARAVLAVSLLLHVVAAAQLTRLKRAARPVGYERYQPEVSTWGGRTIRFGGVAILIFVILHLLHLTTGDIHPTFVPGDVYGNVVSAFSVWWISALYVIAMVALALHLYHGVASAVQTAGITHTTISPRRKAAGWILAAIVAGGFSIVPIAILLGLIGGAR